MNKKTSRKRPQSQKNRFDGKVIGKRANHGAEPRGPRYNRAVENRIGWL